MSNLFSVRVFLHLKRPPSEWTVVDPETGVSLGRVLETTGVDNASGILKLDLEVESLESACEGAVEAAAKLLGTKLEPGQEPPDNVIAQAELEVELPTTKEADGSTTKRGRATLHPTDLYRRMAGVCKEKP